MHPIRELKDRGDGAGGYSNSSPTGVRHQRRRAGPTSSASISRRPAMVRKPRRTSRRLEEARDLAQRGQRDTAVLDVTGDGRPELIMASETEGMVGYLEIPTGEKVYEK